MKNVRLIRVLLFVFVCMGAVSALAETPSDIKYEDVTRVLRFKSDPVPSDFLKCGSRIDSVLVDILTDRKVDVEICVRAARALGWYPGSRSRAVLTSTMATPDENKEVRAAAMFGIARLLGGLAIGEMKPWLSNSSPVIRSGAATALALIGGPRVKQILMDTISHEVDLEVRMLMDSALNKMSEKERPALKK